MVLRLLGVGRARRRKGLPRSLNRRLHCENRKPLDSASRLAIRPLLSCRPAVRRALPPHVCTTAAPADPAARPRRAIARATFIAVAFLGLFYAFIVWTVIQAYGSDKVVQAATDDAGGLFFAAITTYVGAWAADLMHVLIVSSVIASLRAFRNAINRYTLSLIEEGLLPPVLGRIHPRHRSPYLAGAPQTAVGAVVVAG
ncbi:hypothetical protein SF12_20615, partial [Streptomyces sp. MBRL 601]